MSGELGAAGDIATATLIGRAFEPRAGETSTDQHGAGMCLNCGTALIGDYCHACGQPEHIHRTIGSIGHDLLHGVFHFEGKIWRTLPMLAWRPGELTRRYIHGERARFVSPLALFLFSVFLMFAVIHAVAGELEPPEIDGGQRTQAVRQIDAEIARTENEVKQAKTAADEPNTDVVALQGTLAALRGTRATLNTDSDHHFRPGRLVSGWHALDKGLAKANANPGLMLYKLQTSAYKYSWALIPLSTPLVALLFLWRRGYRMYDHALFVTYSLSFMTLWVIVLTLAGVVGIGAGWVVLGALGVPPVHIARQLRGAYQLRWFSALWRTGALLAFSFIVLSVFLVALLAMGILE